MWQYHFSFGDKLLYLEGLIQVGLNCLLIEEFIIYRQRVCVQVGEPGPKIPDLVLEPQSLCQILIFAHLCLHILVFHSEDLHVPLPLPVDPSLIDLVPLGPLLKFLVKLQEIVILLRILYLL